MEQPKRDCRDRSEKEQDKISSNLFYCLQGELVGHQETFFRSLYLAQIHMFSESLTG